MGGSLRALRHGMAGVPGFELFGPWQDAQLIKQALETAGEKYQLRKVGALAFPTTCLESGWMPLPCPAIYHSEEMRPYRDWMTPMNLEVMGSLGGSLVSDNILDYYADPIEVGYGPLVDFDHDFIGRHALAEKIKSQKRKKVTLVWNEGDVTDVIRSSLFAVDSNGKFMNMPLSVYSTFQCDEVTKNGGRAGIYAAHLYFWNRHLDLREVGAGLAITAGLVAATQSFERRQTMFCAFGYIALGFASFLQIGALGMSKSEFYSGHIEVIAQTNPSELREFVSAAQISHRAMRDSWPCCCCRFQFCSACAGHRRLAATIGLMIAAAGIAILAAPVVINAAMRRGTPYASFDHFGVLRAFGSGVYGVLRARWAPPGNSPEPPRLDRNRNCWW